jgi:hypothetical protein
LPLLSASSFQLFPPEPSTDFSSLPFLSYALHNLSPFTWWIWKYFRGEPYKPHDYSVFFSLLSLISFKVQIFTSAPRSSNLSKNN